MIQADYSIFPHNVVELVEIPLKAIDPDLFVAKRPLRNTDPAQSVGVHATAWNPDEESYEFRGGDDNRPSRPTLQQYLYGAQAFVKDGDEERGLAVHSTLANAVRMVLYNSEPLGVALGGLTVTFQDGTVERLKRWGIRTARYFSGEIESNNLYLSTLEFWVETETH